MFSEELHILLYDISYYSVSVVLSVLDPISGELSPHPPPTRDFLADGGWLLPPIWRSLWETLAVGFSRQLKIWIMWYCGNIMVTCLYD